MSFFLLLLYVAASYLRPMDFFPSLGPYRLMLFLGLVALLFALFRIVTRGSYPFPKTPLVLMAGLVAGVVLSRASHGWLGGALAALSDFLINTAVFFLVILNVNTLRRFKILAGLLIFLSLVLVTEGLAALHFDFMSDFFILVEGTVTEAGDLIEAVPRLRGPGFLHDPNDLAQALAISIPFVWLAWRKRQRLRNTLFVLAPTAFLVYGIYLTRSRGGLLSLMVLAFLAMAPKLGRVKSVIAVVLLVLIVLAGNFTAGRSFTPDESSSNRIDQWATGFQLLKQNPIAGAGFNSFSVDNELTAHNSFVLCFSELGLFGYFFWLGLISTVLFELTNVRRAVPGNEAAGEETVVSVRNAAYAVQVALITFLASAFFLSRTYIMTLYLLLSMGIALVGIARGEGLVVAQLSPGRLTWRTSVLVVASIASIYVMVRLRTLLGT